MGYTQLNMRTSIREKGVCPSCKDPSLKMRYPIIYQGKSTKFMCKGCKIGYIIAVYHELTSTEEKLKKIGLSRSRFYAILKKSHVYKIRKNKIDFGLYDKIFLLHNQGFTQPEIAQKVGVTLSKVRRGLVYISRKINRIKLLKVDVPWNLWEVLMERVPKDQVSTYVSKCLKEGLQNHHNAPSLGSKDSCHADAYREGGDMHLREQ
jgi:hypothetical protein